MLKFHWSLPQLGGAAALVGAQASFIIAARETTAANAIFIQYTAPVFVAFFGIHYLREPVGRLDWLALAAIAVGAPLLLQRRAQRWWRSRQLFCPPFPA